MSTGRASITRRARRPANYTAHLAVALLALAAGGVRGAPQPDPSGWADLILVNGRIHTADVQSSTAAALASHNGRILLLGSDAAVRALAGPGTQVIDLAGRAATPGLIDTHAHLADGAREALRSIDLGDVKSLRELDSLVAQRAAKARPGEWVLGVGWDEGKLAERRYPTASELDAAAPRNPVWLVQTTGHYGAANGRALKLAGIDRNTADPPSGTIDRLPDGNPSGVLKEAAAGLVTRLIPEPDAAAWRAAVDHGLELLAREGMTGVKDPDVSPAEWDAYVARDRERGLTAHVCVLWHTTPTVAGAHALVERLAALPRPPANAFPDLISCGVKVYMDGSGGARTAWMYADWNRGWSGSDPGNTGYPAVDPQLYRQLVHIYNDAGLHIGTHAIGDRAIDWVVDSYAEALEANPRRGLRHAIIHANIPTDHAIERMANLQRRFDAAYPETQAEFMWWLGDNYAGNLGPRRAQRLLPLHTYIERGVRFGNGSDYPVTPLPARYGLRASVERRTSGARYGQQPFGTKESIDREAALVSFTRWAAPQLFIEQDTGVLEPGKLTDVAVWDHDPLEPGTDLEALRCELTLFRGRIVWQAPGSPLTVSPR